MLTAYRVYLNDGSNYVTSMATGVTLGAAQEYFKGYYDERTPNVRMVTVEAV